MYCPIRLGSKIERERCLIRAGGREEQKGHYLIRPNYRIEGECCPINPGYRIQR